MAEEIKKTPGKETTEDNVLYLGIDLGTSETTVCASNGISARRKSVVGWPKDLISQKLLGKEILFGEEALKHKLALNLYRPLENGVIKDSDGDLEASKELIKYIISLAKPKKYDKVYAVIGAPARATFANHQSIIDAAREVVEAVMIVSEPFSVAYGEGKISNAIVIDIGAGTTDICSLKGTMPEDEDQITLLKAGDYIDNILMDSIRKKIEGAQITKDMARRWKEDFSFVMEPERPAIVEITIQGKPVRVDITKNVQEACESIVPDIVACVKSSISAFDPEFQNELKQNIILAGGGSVIRNLDKRITKELRSLGSVRVSNVQDPFIAGAKGALTLAKDLTDDYWRAL
jgi:rod shape-determining protein MreB